MKRSATRPAPAAARGERRPRWSSPRCAAALLIALAALAAPGRARAAGSSPVLTLASVDAFVGSSGGRLVVVGGSFNFDDLVQIPFPHAGLLVVQGTHWARFEVDGGAFEGTSALVSDGVTDGDLPALLAAGTPAATPARLAHLGRDEVSVVLSGSFSPGTASVVIVAEHDSEYFVSNSLDVVLP